MSNDTVFYSAEEYENSYRPQALQLVADHLNKDIALCLNALHEEVFEFEAHGSYFYNAYGKRYFDAATAGGVFALGHAHPQIVEAVCQQAAKGGLSTRAGFVPKNLELLKRLSTIVPGNFKHGHIGSTGTEVNEAAFRLARLVTGRSKIVSMDFGYHGMSMATVSSSGIEYCHKGSPDELPNLKRIPYHNLQAASEALTDDVAAVILEPVQWAACCRVATPEYLQGMRKLCDERGTLLIFDEIQTGMGRTGKWFAAEHAQVIPDMITIGKTLSGGMVPISALMYSDKVHQAEAQIPTFLNSTYAGNPLACSAALATINVIEKQNLLQRVNELSKRIVSKLDALCASFPDIISHHDGIGLMRCVMTRTPQQGVIISALLHKEHEVWFPAMLYNPTSLRLSPPYTTTDEELEELFAQMTEVCKKIRKMGPEGIMAYFINMQRKIEEARAKAKAQA